MIFGNIKNFDSSKTIFSPMLLKALNYVKENDFMKMETGVYEIEGKDLYAQVFDIDTKDKSETRPEVHREYIDLQFSVCGNEIIGYAVDTDNNKISESLLEERDIIFYEACENEFELEMNKGDFAVFFPTDVHRPACKNGTSKNIRKVVVKVKISSL